MLEHSRRELS